MRVRRGTIDIIVRLSREIQERRESVLSKNGPFINGPASRYFHLLENLDPQVKWELIALMWIGRDEECDPCEFDNSVMESKKHGDERAAYYLSSKPLHEYLPAALAKMKNCGATHDI